MTLVKSSTFKPLIIPPTSDKKAELNNLKKEMNEIIKKQDYAAAEDMWNLLMDFTFSMQGKSKEFWIQLFAYYHHNFDEMPWTDEEEARDCSSPHGAEGASNGVRFQRTFRH